MTYFKFSHTNLLETLLHIKVTHDFFMYLVNCYENFSETRYESSLNDVSQSVEFLVMLNCCRAYIAQGYKYIMTHMTIDR
jgi:hypothetical protein